MATGVTSSSTNILSGGASSIRLRGWFSQQLKALLLYLLRMYFLSIGRFSGVGAQGSWGLLVGGGDRLGQVHGDSVADGTPELVHCTGLVMGLSLAGEVVTVSQEPTCWY